MGSSSIPVDILNPGQVFSCLGFMETAGLLGKNAEGAFNWEDSRALQINFDFSAEGLSEPVEDVLNFLSDAEVRVLVPKSWIETNGENEIRDENYRATKTYPSKEINKMSFPVELCVNENTCLILEHWTDGSGREPFKLYAGNRTAASVIETMTHGVVSKKGKIEREGIRQLLQNKREELIKDPFGKIVEMGGSFNFDPRQAWRALDTGYSPNDHNQSVQGSPLVEILSAIGLQNFRPKQNGNGNYFYSVWKHKLPLELARVALANGFEKGKSRTFGFELVRSGKQKNVQYAEEVLV